MNPTLRSLHGIAELLLAGPQYRASGTVRLKVTGGGFGTTRQPELRLDGDRLVAGERVVALNGRTYADAASAVGIEAGAPDGLYADGSAAEPGETIVLEPEITARALNAFALGQRALPAFAPGCEPVLWPEHFDLGIVLGEVNYGISPGDSYSPEPYAYVGPHRPREGAFWNAPFGAARPFASAEEIVAFFREAPL
ncbi:hypothetical protein HFP15_00040 [Amycolatopsis sp. K13G38]|uniref:Uncharacterized protein n=1 Tax=Amycolatopsis acididurans TaxID=2724524 RepID=A0ABX1IUX3_9PSEU|nr:hypothetical protein [Amycolatopsis acididurans]NKQ51268.1 hypothetical protein [Amycolatopsis acididurans]